MAKHAKPTKSNSLLPLIILFVVLCIAGAIGFIVYSIVQEVAKTTEKKMEKKNISFSKEGMKVGVKEMSTEEYEAAQQNMLVKMWSNSSFKGRFDSWGTPPGSASGTPASTPGVGSEKRKPFSRSGSSQAAGKRS